MKAITLHQPWATLMVTRPPCDCLRPGVRPQEAHNAFCSANRMVKVIETRSWPAPKALIGQRIAIHAGVKLAPDPLVLGDYRVRGFGRSGRALEGPGLTPVRSTPKLEGTFMPLGAVVGSFVLDACVPMVAVPLPYPAECLFITPERQLRYYRFIEHYAGMFDDLSDQRPFGDFAPGRWAWIVRDAAPCTERCPACWGTCYSLTADHGNVVVRDARYVDPCPVCDSKGRCAPIPAKGAQRIWNWTLS